ncbi:MAG: Asp-tRNA(Asn)/Glu-tRNA(Gln) amidotransferase subunit GatC [Candidatus Omnitrophica bacterium]|nr:Asp-tRNA(Asn)/Glu-tRNA(Gln) amidotransferase subunit GatC [Candidatus Omnitrophota bacterium]
MDNPKNEITNEIVEYAARLARLSLSEKEVAVFKVQLGGILNYVSQLNEIDTSNTPPTSHAIPSLLNVFREDVPVKSLPREEALKNAPDESDGFFRVPRVI